MTKRYDNHGFEIKENDRFIPSTNEIDYGCINVIVTDIDWEVDEEDSTIPPEEAVICLSDLVYEYGLLDFDDAMDMATAINEWLSDNAGYLVNNYNYKFDHERKQK